MDDLNSVLLALDRELEQYSWPKYRRALEAFNRLKAAGLADENSDLFEAIDSWFVERYGEQAAWDGVIGVQPVVVRGVLGAAKIRFALVEQCLNLAEQFEDLPKEIFKHLSEPEIYLLLELMAQASSDFCALYDLERLPDILSTEQKELINLAWSDLRRSATTLRTHEDSQGSIFESHQAAEKALKAALIGWGEKKESFQRKYSHNLTAIISALGQHHTKYNFIRDAVLRLQYLLGSMEIRYTRIPRSAAHAVEAFCAARTIFGFLAKQWILDSERKAPTLQFESGKFYRNYGGQTYKCISITRSKKGNSVRMFLLNQKVAGHLVDVEVRMDAGYGYFYVELTDKGQTAPLESRYLALTGQSGTD